MVGESRSVLPPAKRLKTEEGETLPAADEMSTETPAEEEEEEEMSTESLYACGWPWSPSEDLKPYNDPDNDTPFDKMMDAYDSLDHELSNPLGYQVLADKDIIYSWGPISETCFLYRSNSALLESLGIAKKIVDEHNMRLDMADMVCCLKDLAADWCRRMRIRGIKEFEKFLLRFWEKNRTAPTAAEINGFRKEWRRATSAKFGARARIALTDCDIREGRDIVWLLREGISTVQELEREIEATYKEKLSEIHACRPHFLRRKLDEVEKSGLAKEIVEHYPAFGKLDVPRMEMDPWGVDKDQLLEH